MEHIIKLQLALFFESPNFRPDTMMDGLNSDMGNLFDAMPQVIPIPSNAPLEIPRVQMRSEDGRYSCNISASRIDLFFNGNGQAEPSWNETTVDFLYKSRLFIESVSKKFPLSRFGIIGTFFVPDNLSSRTLTSKYLKSDLNNAEEINIRFNKRSNSHGLLINNITSINTARSEGQDNNENGILVELDINNVPNESSLSKDAIIGMVENTVPLFSSNKVKGLIR